MFPIQLVLRLKKDLNVDSYCYFEIIVLVWCYCSFNLLESRSLSLLWTFTTRKDSQFKFSVCVSHWGFVESMNFDNTKLCGSLSA